MAHELDYTVSADEVTIKDLYPKGNPRKLHPKLFPKRNPQGRYTDLFPDKKTLHTRRALLRKAPKVFLGAVSLGVSTLKAWQAVKEQVHPDQSIKNETIESPIYLPSLPDAYLDGWAIIDFSANHQIDTSAFEDHPFDPTEVDFYNRYTDIDVDRLIIVQNPFIDVRMDNLGKEERWLTLITYNDSTSREFLTGGSYRGIYINTEPGREFDSVFYVGSAHGIEEPTPEEVAYNPDHRFIRSSDGAQIDGSIIGIVLPQYPKSYDDMMKNNLKFIEEQKDKSVNI